MLQMEVRDDNSKYNTKNVLAKRFKTRTNLRPKSKSWIIEVIEILLDCDLGVLCHGPRGTIGFLRIDTLMRRLRE